ncbi:uncharacterized protein LOC141833160 [Curcuma longa]|uniref:uncharacterized protein LOC141833160 n=1 Tax=Curcuma longa TaxID=136217 RepID=UPI003D9EC0E2
MTTIISQLQFQGSNQPPSPPSQSFLNPLEDESVMVFRRDKTIPGPRLQTPISVSDQDMEHKPQKESNPSEPVSVFIAENLEEADMEPDQMSVGNCTEPQGSPLLTEMSSIFGLADLFEKSDCVPVASGSVAQVHRASLKIQYPGQWAKCLDVTVKVRHPGVGESIKRDFMIIKLVARISNFIPTLKWLRLDESVQQFAIFMMSQVDLAREAAHLSRFIYNFRRWKDVSFPKPVYPLVHPAVLVETYEHGESVSRYVDELEGHDRLKSALAHIGTNALLKMISILNLGKGKLINSFTFWGSREGDAVHPAECMHQLLDQVRRHKVNIDGNVCTAMVTTLVLEGWQRKLDPDYDIMKTLQKLLFRSDWSQSLQYTIEGIMVAWPKAILYIFNSLKEREKGFDSFKLGMQIPM